MEKELELSEFLRAASLDDLHAFKAGLQNYTRHKESGVFDSMIHNIGRLIEAYPHKEAELIA